MDVLYIYVFMKKEHQNETAQTTTNEKEKKQHVTRKEGGKVVRLLTGPLIWLCRSLFRLGPTETNNLEAFSYVFSFLVLGKQCVTTCPSVGPSFFSLQPLE